MKILLLTAFTLALTASGCSLFFGNIKPVEEKSNSYIISDVSLTNSNWKRVDAQDPSGSPTSRESSQTGLADMAFQSQDTSSMISVSSACKKYPPEREETLSDLSRELLLGISDVTLKNEKDLIIDAYPALQTTVQGTMNKERVMIRTVVVQKANCVYDMVYVSRPDRFSRGEKDFSKFVSSLRLK